MDGARRVLPLLVWLTALGAGLVLFHALGTGVMATPPLTDPDAWGPWAADRDPPVIVAAVLRLLVLALAWYLVGVTSVGIAARLVRLAGVVRVADAVTLPMVRRLVQAALGVGLATAMVGASTAPHPRIVSGEAQESVALLSPEELETGQRGPWADAGRPAGTVALTSARPEGSGDEGGAGAGGAWSDASADRSSPLSMRLLEQDQPGAGPAPDARAGTTTSEVGLRRAVEGADAGEVSEPDRTRPHRVAAGESLWSISQDTLADAWGREPADTEVLGYWRELIEGNRDALADPDNPDLIFPGDTLRLPPVDRG